MNSIHELLQKAFDGLQSRLVTAGISLDQLQVPEFLALVSSPAAHEHYKHFSSESRTLVAKIRVSHGVEGQRLMLYAALLNGIQDTLASDRFESLPGRVRNHQLVQYRRILECTQPADDWLDLSLDTYHKEFGLASLRLYAAAAQLIDPRCGLPRSLLFQGGLVGIPKAARAMWSLGGFSPYFQIHTHTAYLAEFNEEGWNECYRTCVELYAVHPEILGMFGASWFYDPVIKEISPRLAYLSEVPLKGDAQRLPFAKTGGFVEDAISTSPSRRKLYEEGKYRPASFLLAWGRAEQSKWVLANQCSTVSAT